MPLSEDSAPTIPFHWENKRLLLAHGTPWSNDVYVFPYSSPPVFKRVIQLARADIVILGHTHKPMIAQVGQTWIFNPGSVCGAASQGSGTCAILSLPECSFQVYEIERGQPLQAKYVKI